MRTLVHRRAVARAQSLVMRPRAGGYTDVYAIMRVTIDDANYPLWYFGVEKFGGVTYFYAWTGRATSIGFQEYDWITELPNADVAIGTRLKKLSIHTGTDLGAFGQMDMEFRTNQSDLKKIRCARTDAVLGHKRRASGFIRGTIAITPGLPGLPALVTQSGAPIKLDRDMFNGKKCPQPAQCANGKAFRVLSGDDAGLWAYPYDGSIQVQTRTKMGDLTLYRWAVFFGTSGGASTNAITVTPTDLTIDGTEMNDLFDGSVVFDRSSPPTVKSGARCRTTRTPFLWREGSLDVLFDAGTFSFTSVDLDAHMFWYTRNR